MGHKCKQCIHLEKYILGSDEAIIIIESNNAQDIYLTNFDDVKHVLKKRNRDSHKGTYGRVGVVAGSKGMAGAAVFNINGALRCGSGLVKAFVAEEIYAIIEAQSLETITSTYDTNHFSYKALKEEIVAYSDVVVTGSGCANLTIYKNILKYLLDNCVQPLVIDAEGINVLSLNDLKEHSYPLVLTPHYGEMAKLIHKDIDYVRDNIIHLSRDFSQEYRVYLVLKGARTVIACPDGQAFINTTGNPGMATAGSGDVLAGVIASLIGQGIEIKDALRAAVYLHGLAGDIAVSHVGEYSLIAGDLIKYLPHAIMKLTEL